MFPTVKDIKAKYEDIQRAIARKPAKDRPKLPALKKCDKYTIQGLTLTFFACHLGKIVNKIDLVLFLRRMRVSTTDPQPRHLGMQNGFDFLVAGCRHPKCGRVLKCGQYCLLSMSKRHPSHEGTSHRAMKVSDIQFERLKRSFVCRCASCGSSEGEPHLKNKRLETRLEKGHMDPRKELVVSNCLPMCSMCNGVYKDKAVFNRNGFIKKWLK